jgi:hypothetical protein
MITSKTANGTMGSFKTSEIDSIGMSVVDGSNEFEFGDYVDTPKSGAII